VCVCVCHNVCVHVCVSVCVIVCVSLTAGSDCESLTDGQLNASSARKGKAQFPVAQPRRLGPGPGLDVFASAKEWAKNFERMDRFREIIRGPPTVIPPIPPPAPVVPPPSAPPPSLDLATMVGLFKGLAEVMVAVTGARGVQQQAAPAPVQPVQLAAAADPLTLANFERLLAALGKSSSDK
jgi:hypothetical protein